MSDEAAVIDRVAALAASNVQPQYVTHMAGDEDDPVAKTAIKVLPPGYSLAVINTEWNQPAPSRLSGVVTLRKLGDFIDFANLYKEHPGFFIFGTDAGGPGEIGFQAIVNHHADEPGWGDYVIQFRPRLTEEWRAWSTVAGKPFGQREFAEFIEDRLGDIALPERATLLEAIQTLQFKTNIAFQSNIRLENDTVQMVYREELEEGHGLQGEIRLPTRLGLVLRPYDDAQVQMLEARLRYSVRSNKAEFRIVFGDELRAAMDAALAADAESVLEALGKRVLWGSASGAKRPDALRVHHGMPLGGGDF